MTNLSININISNINIYKIKKLIYFKNTDPNSVLTDPRLYYPDSDSDTPNIIFSE